MEAPQPPPSPENRSLPDMNGNELQRTHLHACPQRRQMCVFGRCQHHAPPPPISKLPRVTWGPRTSSRAAQRCPARGAHPSQQLPHTCVGPQPSPSSSQLQGTLAPGEPRPPSPGGILLKKIFLWGVSKHQGPVVPTLTSADVYIPGLFVL